MLTILFLSMYYEVLAVGIIISSDYKVPVVYGQQTNSLVLNKGTK